MLNEFLKKQKEELKLQIEVKENLNNIKSNLDEELSKLNEEIDRIKVYLTQKFNEFKRIEAEKKKSPLKTFFKEKFLKNYNDNILSLKNDMKKNKLYIEELLSQKKNKEEEYKVIQEKIIFIEEKEKELVLLDNEEYAIQKLINEKPDALSNHEVMIDLTQKNMVYIYLDKMDNKEVYFYLIAKALAVILDKIEELEYEKRQLLKYIDECDEEEKKKRYIRISEIDDLIKEKEDVKNNFICVLDDLRNSKAPLDGKYKIPYKFLFEAFRKGALLIKNKCEENDNTESSDLMIAEVFGDICSDYLKINCNYYKSYCEMIEEFYTSKDVDLYFYSISDEERKYVDKIFKNGLTLDSEFNFDLSSITLAQYQKECNFLTFLNNKSSLVLAIPRNESLILGNNTGAKDDVYILPQYVLGEVRKTTSGPKFRENTIPLDERTVYDYTYPADKGLERTKDKSR